MSVPESLEGFDVSAAVERMLGDPDLWWKSVGIFVGHFSGWEDAWVECSGDDVKERKCVHALRSAAANVGASDLSTVAGILEDALLRRLAGDAEDIPEEMRRDLRYSFRQTWSAAAVAWQSANPEKHG